ncbi:MAG: hypothetical protein HC911_18230 [Chloroflexaceae bacterium]|nr:hypothetical protein [Chloroflexaceae bacterium]
MRRTIFVPESDTQGHPPSRLGLVEARITRVLADGSQIAQADNGQTYRVQADGLAIERIETPRRKGGRL